MGKEITLKINTKKIRFTKKKINKIFSINKVSSKNQNKIITSIEKFDRQKVKNISININKIPFKDPAEKTRVANATKAILNEIGDEIIYISNKHYQKKYEGMHEIM
jgi:hypothetical protein